MYVQGSCAKREYDGATLYNTYYQWVSLYLVFEVKKWTSLIQNWFENLFIIFTYCIKTLMDWGKRKTDHCIFKINLNLWITILQQILRRAPLFILLNCNETPCTFIHFHKICKVWPRTSEISKTKEFIKCRLLNQLIMECCIYLVF